MSAETFGLHHETQIAHRVSINLAQNLTTQGMNSPFPGRINARNCFAAPARFHQLKHLQDTLVDVQMGAIFLPQTLNDMDEVGQPRLLHIDANDIINKTNHPQLAHR